MSPLDNPEAYEVAEVDGLYTPGLCEIRGAADKRKWDKQDGKGQSGGTVKFGGREIEDFDLVIFLWLPEHFTQFSTFRRVLEPPTEANPRAVGIFHPQLAELGITLVNVRQIGQIERAGDDGLWQVTIGLSRAAPPVPATVVPKGGRRRQGDRLGEGARRDQRPAEPHRA